MEASSAALVSGSNTLLSVTSPECLRSTLSLNIPRCRPRSSRALSLSYLLALTLPPVSLLVSDTSAMIAASPSLSPSDGRSVTPSGPQATAFLKAVKARTASSLITLSAVT